MIKKLIISMFSVGALFAGSLNIYGIEDYEGLVKFSDQELNRQIKMPSGCMTLEYAFNVIERQSGLLIDNKTNIDPKNVICNLNSYKRLGQVLEAIIKDSDKTFYVKDLSLVIESTRNIVSVFPENWNLEATRGILKSKYPNTKFFIYGKTLKASTSSLKYESIDKDMSALNTWAFRYIPFMVNVEKIKDLADDNINIDIQVIPRKTENLEIEEIKQYSIDAVHGRVLQTFEIPVPITWNLQENTVSMGKKTLSLDELYKFCFKHKEYRICLSRI